MLNTKRWPVLCWMALLLFVAAAQAQVAPSAYGPGHSLWVGGEYSNINASFPYLSDQRLWGIGAFADYNVTGPWAWRRKRAFSASTASTAKPRQLPRRSALHRQEVRKA